MIRIQLLGCLWTSLKMQRKVFKATRALKILQSQTWAIFKEGCKAGWLTVEKFNFDLIGFSALRGFPSILAFTF